MGRLTPEEATRTARARGTSSTPEGVRLHTGRCPVCCASARLYAGRCPAYHAPGYLRFLLASHHADVCGGEVEDFRRISCSSGRCQDATPAGVRPMGESTRGARRTDGS